MHFVDRTERFYKIDQLLQARRPGVVPISVFLEELDVSLATFKRDLEYMRERLYAPIVWDRDQNGYRFEAREQAEAIPTSSRACGSAPPRRRRCSPWST